MNGWKRKRLLVFVCLDCGAVEKPDNIRCTGRCSHCGNDYNNENESGTGGTGGIGGTGKGARA